jgi:hypothetical protein
MKGALITVGNIASDLSEIGLSTCSFILALFELLDQFIELLGHTLFDNVVIKGLQHSTELGLNVAPQLSTGPANLFFAVHRRLWSHRPLYRHPRAGLRQARCSRALSSYKMVRRGLRQWARLVPQVWWCRPGVRSLSSLGA